MGSLRSHQVLKAEHIENVFKSSAEFCHVRSLADPTVDAGGVAKDQSKLTQDFRMPEDVLIKGPDDVELIVERYPNGYVWKIRNGSLQAIKQPGLEIVSTQSFDAKKVAFREPIASGVAWVSRRLPAGEVSKSTILVRIEGDHLELGDTVGMHQLLWPSGDPAINRRWVLTIKVLGISQEWPIELDLRWTHGTKTLLLADNSHVTGADSNLGSAGTIEAEVPLPAAKKRGRRPNQERRDAIQNAISTHGDEWRDHLSDIFNELDAKKVPLGDFQGKEVTLGDGETAKVWKWEDLDLAEGEQRGQILDALRKYTG